MAYGKTDPNAVAADQIKSPFYKIPERGDEVFFCPPWNERQNKPYREVKLHYQVGSEPLLCLKQVGESCPICDVNAELFNKKNDPAAQEISKQIYAKTYWLYNVLGGLRTVPNPSSPHTEFAIFNGPINETPIVKPFPVGKKLQAMLLAFHNHNGDIFDPTAGNIIQLTKTTEAGKDPKYAQPFATAHPKKCQLDPKLMELMNTLPDLDAFYKKETPARLKELIEFKVANFKITQQSQPSGPMPATQQQVMAPFQQNPVPNQNVMAVQTQMEMPPKPVVLGVTNPMPNQSVTNAQVPVQAQVVANPVVTLPVNTLPVADLAAFETFLAERKAKEAANAGK